MTASSRRILATLLLASYGLVSACGYGLHALDDGSHDDPATNCSSEHHHPTPESPASDHSDCLICHVVGQGQLSLVPPPVDSEMAEVAEVLATTSISPCATDRLIGDPRAPPLSLA